MNLNWKILSSHLVALGLGAALHLGVNKITEADGHSSSQARSTERITPPRESGAEGLDHYIRENEIDREVWRKKFELTSAKRWEQRKLDLQRRQAEHKRKLEHLLVLAATYDKILDLNPIITDALTQYDEDTLQAVFLSMYNRNPSEAFKALSLRSNWIHWLKPPVWLHLGTDTLIDQLGGEHYHRDLEYAITKELAVKMASDDDLASLLKALQSPNAATSNLTSTFAANWAPLEPKKSVDYIFQKLPSDIRAKLLKDLVDERFENYPHILDDPEFGKAMLEYQAHLSEEYVDRINKFLAEATKRPNEGNLITHDSNYLRVPHDLTGKDLSFRLEMAIDAGLQGDKDFPELLIKGAISVDQIAQAVSDSIEGEERHSELFNKLLYQILAYHAPEAARNWAAKNLSTEDFHDGSHKVIQSIRYAPRSKRALYVARLLFPQTDEPDLNSYNSAHAIRYEQKNWMSIAPDEASRFLQSLPANPAQEEQLKAYKLQEEEQELWK